MKLRIKVGNVEFEADGNEAEVKRERAALTEFLEHLSSMNSDIIMRTDTTQAGQSSILLEDATQTEASQSFNEFLATVTTKAGTDLVMAAAYYLYKYRGADSFTSKAIEELLTDSHIKRPNNISQAIIQNIKKGFISLVKNDEPGLNTYQVLTSADGWFDSVKVNMN